MIPNGDARPAVDPSESSFVRLAEAYRREGLLEDAIRICREGLTRFPTTLRGRIFLGQILLEQGETPEATAELTVWSASLPGIPRSSRSSARRAPRLPRSAPMMSDRWKWPVRSRARPKPGTPRPTSRVSSSWIFPSTPNPPGCTRRMPRSTRWRARPWRRCMPIKGIPSGRKPSGGSSRRGGRAERRQGQRHERARRRARGILIDCSDCVTSCSGCERSILARRDECARVVLGGRPHHVLVLALKGVDARDLCR